MLLDDSGLNIRAFDPVLATVLGKETGEEGCRVLAETIRHGRATVHLRDWLYCLARASGTDAHRWLIQVPGQKPETLVDTIEAAFAEDDTSLGTPPDRLTPAVVEPDVLKMLAAAEEMAEKNSSQSINDSALTLALLNVADQDLKDLLEIWATEEGMNKLFARLRAGALPKVLSEDSIFNQDRGELNKDLFSPSGRTFCRRFAEDAASLGAKKVTTRHMLYTLLGSDSGLLSLALTVRGVNVKRDLHATLSRELVQTAKKRNDQFILKRDTIFGAVEQVFLQSCANARQRGAERIAECDISRAFLRKQSQELSRLYVSEKPLDLTGLPEYLDSAEPEEEEEPQSTRLSIEQIEERIKNRICGQELAIERIMPWIKRLRFGLPRDGRPAAVFLFLGPTGCGKTQLAKELARHFYGDEDMMIFLEMGQFKTKESMNVFVGSPPGYVGYGEGVLTNGLRDKPESVVLFDEIEKANTQVFDTLLRFADEGLISDPAGPIRDGRKCIIVMTTNAGQIWLRDHLKANPQAQNDPDTLVKQLFAAAMDELNQRGFRPEFLGRVDERISFLPLSLDTCRKIVDRNLELELDKFSRLKNVTIDVSEEVRSILAQKAYERTREEGARAAPRAINELIVTKAIDVLDMPADRSDELEPQYLIASAVGLGDVKVEKVR